MSSGNLVAVIFSKDERDLDELIDRIRARQDQMRACPFAFLPTLLEVWSSGIEAWRKALDQQVVAMERSTGMTSISTMKQWELQPHEYEFLTRELHASNTDLVFLFNVVQFEVELGNHFENVVNAFDDTRKLHFGEPLPHDKRQSVLQHLAYCKHDTQFRQNQLQSLKMRVQSQINLVRLQMLTLLDATNPVL